MSSDERSASLRALLISELERHTRTLAQDGAALRHVLHALKGAARLAGEVGFGDALARQERTVAELSPSEGVRRARATLEVALARLRRGESAVEDTWPNAPEGMRRLREVPAHYREEVAERMIRLELALSEGADVAERAKDVARELHTIKGAAGAVEDELLSWFVHGLEGRLRRASSDAVDPSVRAELSLQEVGKHLPALRMIALGETPRRRKGDSSQHSLASVRVQSASIDALFERMQGLRNVQQRLGAKRVRLRRNAARARELKRDVVEALRLIGPPRPWGAPAAAIHTLQACAAELSRLSGELDESALNVALDGEQLGGTMRRVSKDLATMRESTVRELFQRVAHGAQVEAKRLGKVVVIEMLGATETVDRKILESLLDPCVHLVRNCIAHGIETPSERTSAGKSEAGVIRLSATKRGGRLLLSVSDDGRGVDIEQVRVRAEQVGLANREVLELLRDDAVLSLLMTHGFSMRVQQDEVAGSGVGLDAVLTAVHLLGGTVSLGSTAGFQVHLQIPLEPLGAVRVLWVRAGDREFAFPAQDVLSLHQDVRASDLHLRTCIEPDVPPLASARYVLVIDASGTRVAVDDVLDLETVVIRPLSSLAARLGPFLGAIASENSGVRFVIDPLAIAQCVHALMPGSPS